MGLIFQEFKGQIMSREEQEFILYILKNKDLYYTELQAYNNFVGFPIETLFNIINSNVENLIIRGNIHYNHHTCQYRGFVKDTYFTYVNNNTFGHFLLSTELSE